MIATGGGYFFLKKNEKDGSTAAQMAGCECSADRLEAVLLIFLRICVDLSSYVLSFPGLCIGNGDR